MNNFIFEVLCLWILMFPTLWEIADDWKGDHNKRFDVTIRFVLGLISGSIVFLLRGGDLYLTIAMSFALHFFFFDYLLPMLAYGRSNWFSYLGKKGFVDNIGVWRNLNPWIRFIIRLVVLITAFWFYG